MRLRDWIAVAHKIKRTRVHILVIGNGGREHALTWKIKQSPLVERIYCIPGNPGTAEIAENHEIDFSDFGAIIGFCKEYKIDLVVVGPEVPLVNGITDVLEKEGITAFGPSKYAAQLEGSKAFSKDFMKENNIPTAGYHVFTDLEQAKLHIEALSNFPVVLKADGLAAGKGVLICYDLRQAFAGLNEIMSEKSFGSAGEKLVIEEYLDGDEISIFALCDGKDYRLLSPSQDHKKAGEGDTGKNTGGMGAYAPAPLADQNMIQMVENKVIVPTLNAMNKRGHPYKGVLYVGVIVVKGVPFVLEYNCRFGDPETQSVLPLLKTDLVPLLQACATGTLGDQQLQFKNKCAMDVVLVSGGYPDSYAKGYKISGLADLDPAILCFQAGTKEENGELVTWGGRVLNLVGLGDSFQECADKIYKEITKINFTNIYYRKDIGFKVLGSE